jgi:hypothetical protein
MAMGKFEFKHILIADFRLCGQSTVSPSGVASHSKLRTRSPISVRAERNPGMTLCFSVVSINILPLGYEQYDEVPDSERIS